MPVQRKVFRIEQMLLAGSSTPDALGASPADQTEILAELRALHDLMARRAPGTAAPPARNKTSELRSLRDDTDAIHVALGRTKQELAALHVAALGGPGPTRMIRQLDAIALAG